MVSEDENRVKKNCTFEASQKSNFEDGTEALLGLEDIMTSHQSCDEEAAIKENTSYMDLPSNLSLADESK